MRHRCGNSHRAGGVLRCLRCAFVIVYLAVLGWAVTDARSQGWPTSRAARVWRPPAGFIGQAWCVHRHESLDWHRGWLDWRGLPSSYAGGMQFMLSTWRAAGGRGEPWQWSPREQIYRAFVTWRRDGRSWVEWGTRAKCGLR